MVKYFKKAEKQNKLVEEDSFKKYFNLVANESKYKGKISISKLKGEISISKLKGAVTIYLDFLEDYTYKVYKDNVKIMYDKVDKFKNVFLYTHYFNGDDVRVTRNFGVINYDFKNVLGIKKRYCNFIIKLYYNTKGEYKKNIIESVLYNSNTLLLLDTLSTCEHSEELIYLVLAHCNKELSICEKKSKNIFDFYNTKYRYILVTIHCNKYDYNNMLIAGENLYYMYKNLFFDFEIKKTEIYKNYGVRYISALFYIKNNPGKDVSRFLARIEFGGLGVGGGVGLGGGWG